MIEKELAELSDPFQWDRRRLIRECNPHPVGITPPVTRNSKRRLRLKTSLYGLAFLVVGAFIFISGSLCATIVLVDDNCGPAFGPFSCETQAEVESFHALALGLPGG